MILALGAGSALADNSLSAVVETVEGAVDVQIAGKEDWTAAKKGMKLPEGSEIFTGSDAKCKLVFQNVGTAIVGPLTHATVNKFMVKGDDAQAKVDLDVGSVRIDVKKVKLRTDFTVETPHMTAAVKGSGGTSNADAYCSYWAASTRNTRASTNSDTTKRVPRGRSSTCWENWWQFGKMSGVPGNVFTWGGDGEKRFAGMFPRNHGEDPPSFTDRNGIGPGRAPFIGPRNYPPPPRPGGSGGYPSYPPPPCITD
jgi:hypothetical protein